MADKIKRVFHFHANGHALSGWFTRPIPKIIEPQVPTVLPTMDALYDGLDQGKDPATALRDAKLSTLKSNAHTVFAKPFYWAPFQLYTGS